MDVTATPSAPEIGSRAPLLAARRDATWSLLLLVALVFGYGVLGLVVLAPEAVYSGDIGVKFVQARALVEHRFASLDIPYPGAFLDPARAFFPMRAPFVMTSGGSTQAIFSPTSAMLQAVAVWIAGLQGLIGLSVLSSAVILFATWRFASGPGADAAEGLLVLLALGVASPLWFYAVSGWEHAPAVACGTAAFAVAVCGPARLSGILGGLLVGAGGTLRDEVLLLLPGLLFVIWLRTRSVRPVVAAIAAAVVPLAAAAGIEVWWFGRPPAAHLRHAVHLFQSAVHATSAPNPDVPVLEPFTLTERYETVVQYWLLGYGNSLVIAIYAAGLAVAMAVRWQLRSSVGLLIWVLAIVALAALDFRELVTAPKWLAGLHRVAPYLVFALFPRLAGLGTPTDTAVVGGRLPWLGRAVLFTTVAYVVIAFAGADTTGGKSLGPRLLLPLFPLLTVVAIARIVEYARSDQGVACWTGRAGLLLIAASAVMHLCGTIPAYVARNADDRSTVLAVAASPERIVVVDNDITAQLLLPLYYRKIILLADERELGLALGRRLADAHIGSAILVTRRASAAIPLEPFALERAEPVGRMTIQYWRR
jgi:hypothetical protein